MSDDMPKVWWSPSAGIFSRELSTGKYRHWGVPGMDFDRLDDDAVELVPAKPVQEVTNEQNEES